MRRVDTLFLKNNLLLILFLFISTQASAFESCQTPPGETLAQTKIRLSQKLLQAGLRYSREHSHPVTGFVEDTVTNYSDQEAPVHARASISSTGFMMALVANLYIKGMVSRNEAYHYCQRPLVAVLKKKKQDRIDEARRLETGEPNPQTAISYQGWFSHFIDWGTGDRWIDPKTHSGVEYATTDSTWFLAGGIVCSEVFPHTKVSRNFSKILIDVNFKDFMTDGNQNKGKRTISMAYTPVDLNVVPGAGKQREVGYSKAQWKIYQHSWLVYLLGMGAPRADFRLPPESWAAWDRTGTSLTSKNPKLDGKILYGDRRALFSHYFPDVFMPPQLVKESCAIDYLKNSQTATLFNREMAQEDQTSKTFQNGLWGFDAGPNPNFSKLQIGAPLTVGTLDSATYVVNTPYKQNGTACPACAVASVMFEPNMVLRDLKRWCDDAVFGNKIWGKYGPANGINLDYGWISPVALSGIVGPMALSAANLNSKNSVWNSFIKYGAVKRGLVAAAMAPRPAAGCLIPEN